MTSDKRIRYILLSYVVLAVVTAIFIAVLPSLGVSANLNKTLIGIAAFFAIANTLSLYMHGMVMKTRPSMLTTFYLIDKVARLLLGIMFAGLLIYFNRKTSFALAMIFLAYYITAMILEISYFAATERKTKVQDA